MKKIRNENEMRYSLEKDFPVPERLSPENIEESLNGGSKLGTAGNITISGSQSKKRGNKQVYAKGPGLWTIGVAAAAIAVVVGAKFFFGGNGNIESTSEPFGTTTPAASSGESFDGALPAPAPVPTANEDTDDLSIDEVDTSLLSKGAQYYYGKSAVIYLAANNDRYAFEPVSSENEHLRVTIESLLSDDITVNMVAKIEALDEEGEKFLKLDYFQMPWIYAYDTNGNYLDSGEDWYWYGGGSFDTDTCRYFIIDAEKVLLNGAQEIDLKLYDVDSIHYSGEPKEDIVDIFTGITFRIDTTSNLATLTLADENGEEIYISPLGFYRRKDHIHMLITSQDVENDTEGIYTKADAWTFVINYEDGSSKEYDGEINGNSRFGDHHYDIRNVAYIYYNGETYSPQ